MGTSIHDVRRSIFDGTLTGRVNECLAIMRTVIAEEDMELLNLEFLPQEPVTTEELHIDERGVSDVPWAMLCSNDDKVEQMWQIVRVRRSIAYMSTLVEYDKRVIDGCAQDDDPIFVAFKEKAAERAEYLQSLRNELEALLGKNEDFDI